MNPFYYPQAAASGAADAGPEVVAAYDGLPAAVNDSSR
jgi:hypothetical protein